MAENKKKEVTVSKQFEIDISIVFGYGEETFGYNAAKIFIGDIYNHVWNLENMYLIYPECRHLTTKNKIYRNIILGAYLIIYRNTPDRIEVLRVLHSHSSITKIRGSRSIKIK
jgi:plasmid stabilization system protein ParE